MRPREYDCPKCEYPIPVENDADEVQCPDCRLIWAVDSDYSFEEGQWRDKTSLRFKTEGR